MITISIPFLILIVLSLVTVFICFNTLTDSNGGDYGIGSVIAFLLSGFLVAFYASCMFAGAYFRWWIL